MSLEARIELLTAAVIELTAAISLVRAPGAAVDNSPTGVLKSNAEFHAREAETAEEETRGGLTHEEYQSARLPNDQQSSSDTTSGEQSQPTGESSLPELTYDDHVKPATLKLSQKMGREVAIAVLGRFGVKGAQNLDVSQWADYIAHCESVMNGGEV
jgi:hypothetical protein